MIPTDISDEQFEELKASKVVVFPTTPNYKEMAYDLIKKRINDSGCLTDGEVISYIEGVIECAEESARKE